MNIILKILKSNIFQYVFIRYATYIIQFSNAILLAKYIGVYEFGIYSFITLSLQYLTYSNLGVNYSLNTLYAVKKGKPYITNLLWTNALMVTIAIGLIIIASGFVFKAFGLQILTKFEFSENIIFIVVIAFIANMNILYINLYRIYGKLQLINLQQTFFPVILLIVIILYNNKINVTTVLFVQLVTNLLPLIIFFIYSPHKLKLNYNKKITTVLLTKGINLLFYNVSFYFIMISARTIVGAFYSVEELGIYSLAYTVSNSVMLAAGAFSFIFFPKLINRFDQENDMERLKNLIYDMRSLYIVALNFIALLSLVIIPFIVIYIPKYIAMIDCLKLLIIAQLIINNNFGYTTLLIAKNKERKLTVIGFVSIGITIISGLIFLYFNASFEIIAFSAIIACLYFNFAVVKEGQKFTMISKSVKEIFTFLYPMKILIPILLIIISFFVKENIFTAIIILGVFVLLNYKNLIEIYKKTLYLLTNKRVLEF